MEADLLARVLRRIKPSEEERRELEIVSRDALEIVGRACKEVDERAYPILVGSSCRGTWLSGEKEIDIFVLFPDDLSESELEEKGLEIGRRAFPDREERYAEHPYVHAWFRGFEIDVVPCFRVSSPANIKSAVDRTPFHNEFVKERIRGLEDDVLLLKKFLGTLGVYGAELKLRGFSGYLCELLILHYRSFMNFVRSACKWKYGEKIDIMSHGKYEGRDPLIVIDPVDPKRNVAAAVSLDNFCRVIDACRDFLDSPSEKFFFGSPATPVGREELLNVLSKRGTKLIGIFFEVDPWIVDDIIFPQLRKAEKAAISLLHDHGFRVFRSDVVRSGRNAGILLEMEVWALPNVLKHVGPPVTSEYHSRRFKEKYGGRRIYIEDGRFIAELDRECTNAEKLLERKLRSRSIGKNLMECEYKIKVNEENLLDEEISRLVRNFLC